MALAYGGARVLLIASISMLVDPTSREAFQPLLVAALADARTRPEVRSAALRALPLMGKDNAGKNFGLIAAQLRDGKDIAAGAGAIRKLPRDVWAKDQAAPVSTSDFK